MMGYDPEKAWGHVTSGGTVANYEPCGWRETSSPSPLPSVPASRNSWRAWTIGSF
jgi:hypothetical protein